MSWSCCCGTLSSRLLLIVVLATKLFACCEAECRKADSKIEGWEQLKQTKEGVPKRALQAGSAVLTLVASVMAQGVVRPTLTAASHQKRRAAERQARDCGLSAARKVGAGAA